MPNIFIDVFTRLQGRSVDDTEKDLQKRLSKAGTDAGNNFSRNFESSLNASNPRVRKAAERLADATAVVAQNNRLRALSEQRVADTTKATADVEARLTRLRRDGQGVGTALAREEDRLTAARRSSATAERQFIRDTSNFERAAARRVAAIKNLAEAHRGEGRRSGGRGGSGGGLGGAENALGGIFTSIPFVPGGKAGAFIGTGLVTGLGAIAEAVTTASQALWLLPAATAAAGAGFLTLKIGMSGFDKALKDMGDPKKWAEDLQKLSPAAQQAALEIQHLVGGLDSLKSLVQQSLFSGVAQQLHSLGNTFMPSLRQMFTGVSSAFNQMFTGAVGQLTSAGTSAGIGNIINNIVKAFQNLAPAMAPVVDAFVKITQVGSTFLPGMGSSITDLAKRFDDFITHAQQTGQLQHWIQQGLDAAKALGNFLGELAHKFYDVFGNKSPQQFAQTLRGVVGTLTIIGQGIAGLSQFVNRLVQDLQPVARALGGWPNLIKDVVEAWALWKVGGLIGQLGIIQGMLAGGLPAAAEAGAVGINAALAKIVMPAWIATFLALWNLHGDSPGSTASTANDKQIAGNKYFKDKGKMPDGYQQWLQGSGPMPKDLAPYFKPGEKPGQSGAPGQPDPSLGKWGKNNPGYNDPWFDKNLGSAGMAPWSPYAVPAVPDKKGGVGSDKDATPYGPGYDAPPRPGETEEVYSAEGSVMDAKHRLEQDRGTLLEMQQKNNATAEEKQAQENKIAKDQREIYEAQMRLTDAQQEAYKKNLKGLKDADDEFNNIDQDFGLSKGLPGLVKNLVGMLGDMAAAPLMGQLKATALATGTDKNTFGMLGMMGQTNIAEGKSPLFGIPAGQPGGLRGLTPQQYYAIYGDGSNGGPGGSAQTMPSYSAMPGAGPASIAPGATMAGYTSGAPGGAQLASATRPAGGPGGGGLNWDALAAKESSGNWGTNTGNGYFGGLQFDQSTWNAYKPGGAPSNPAQATKDQQIAAGQAGIDARGGAQSLWPQNYDQLYHSPHAPWSAQYNSYQPMGSWLGGTGSSGAAPAGLGGGDGPADLSAGLGGPPPGLGGASMPGASVTYTQAMMQKLGLQPLATNPAGGGNPTLPAWLQDFVHTNGGASLTAGSSPHGSLHGVAGGSDYATDVTGSPVDMDRLASYLLANPSLSAQMIHQSASGTPMGIAGGQNVSGSYYNTPGGSYGDESDMVHWAPAMPSGMPFPGSGPQQANLTGFGQPDPTAGGPGGQPNPSAPGGMDPSAPTPALDAPRGGGWQPQGGGANGIGGLPLAALTSAAGMFPGGGAAAQTAMQLINRTIGYGQQAAAIGIQGLMDTFKISSPDDDGGKSDLSQGWIGRVAAGFAGARPALPNGAGSTPQAKKDSDPSKDPSGNAALGQGGDTSHNYYGGQSAPGGTIINNPPQGPGMNDVNSGLGTQASTPASTSVGGLGII